MRAPALSDPGPTVGHMCGRFVSSSSPDQIARYFDVDEAPEQLLERGPNYNTAPTASVYVVLEDGGTRHLDAFRWGSCRRGSRT